jgi:hypothetical protein
MEVENINVSEVHVQVQKVKSDMFSHIGGI